MKVDLHGNKIWERKYGVGNDMGDYFSDILQIDDHEFVISGSISPGNIPVDEREFIIKIFAIDSIGMVKWSWESEPALDETARGLCRDDNGNWAYTTIHVVYETDGSFKGQPKFIRRDSAFNILQEKELDDADNLLWERKDRTFPDSSFTSRQYLHSAVELPGGNLIAAGYLDAPYDLGILVKVTKDGCIDTLCTTTSLLEQIRTLDDLVKVYPNPASNYLIFKIQAELKAGWVELFDLTGCRMLRKALNPGENVIMLDALTEFTGILAWRVLSESGYLLDSGKVVVSPH